MQCYDYCWCCCSLKTKREREIEKDDCKLDWVPLKRNTIQNIQQTAYKRHEFNTKKWSKQYKTENSHSNSIQHLRKPTATTTNCAKDSKNIAIINIRTERKSVFIFYVANAAYVLKLKYTTTTTTNEKPRLKRFKCANEKYTEP